MNGEDWLAERFEEKRRHLRAVAYRMLGSLSEADDAIQEAWLRLNHSDAGAINNLDGWLTTVIGRVCLDMLRSRKLRKEESFDAHLPDLILIREDRNDPEHEALIADSVGIALLVVLETLAPPERLAFVLHDMFAVPFEEVASIVGCSTVAARQLASRARRRVQGAGPVSDVDRKQQRRIVDAFFAAVREGDFNALSCGAGSRCCSAERSRHIARASRRAPRGRRCDHVLSLCRACTASACQWRRWHCIAAS